MKAGILERLVLHASVAVAWRFEDETTRFTESVRSPIKVSNVTRADPKSRRGAAVARSLRN